MQRIAIKTFKPKNKLLKRCENFSNIKKESNSSDLLDYVIKLAPQEIIKTAFPFAYSTSSHWIYYCFYSSDSKLTKKIGREILSKLNHLDRPNAGIGRRDPDSIFESLKRSKSNHPIIVTNEFSVRKCKDILNKFLENSLEKKEIIEFRKHWISQSPLAKQLAKRKEPSIAEKLKFISEDKKLDTNYRKIILAYSLIRALYGTVFFQREERTEVNDEDFKVYVDISKRLIRELKQTSECPFIFYLEKNGTAPALRIEAMKRKSEGERILKDFRIWAFFKTLRQLDGDISNI